MLQTIREHDYCKNKRTFYRVLPRCCFFFLSVCPSFLLLHVFYDTSTLNESVLHHRNEIMHEERIFNQGQVIFSDENNRRRQRSKVFAMTSTTDYSPSLQCP